MEDAVNILAENIHQKILSKTEEKDRYGIDPLTIILIIGIIVNVIRVIQECNKSKISKLQGSEEAELLNTDVKFRAMHGSFLTRWKLKGVIKKHLDKKQYKVYGDAMLKTLLEAGKNITKEELLAIMEYKNV